MEKHTQVPDGWRLVRLEDVSDFQQGGTPSKGNAEYWGGHVPFLTGADLREFYIGCDNARSFLTDKGLNSGATAICDPGTLLLATRTRVGLTGIAKETMGVSQDITVLSPNDLADPFYLCRTLMRHATLLRRRSRGTTIQGVSREDVASLPILLPPLPEQRAIAAVLDSIDEAIECTEAVIADTERLRESLLHELLTHGVPGWHSEWKEVRGIGTIPADWEIVRLGDIYEVQLGKMLSPKAKQGTNPKPYLTNRNVRWGEFDLSELPTMDFDEREMAKFQLRPGDLLVCEGGEVGRAAVWESQVLECYYQKALHRLRPLDENCLPEFMLAILTYYASRDFLIEHSEKTSISHLTRERLLRMRVPNPARPEQDVIVAIIGHVAASLDCVRNEKERLEAVKTSVADALLTGRVRVSE